MISINSEPSKVLKIQYLETLCSSELAFWLINSFSPERYHDESDVMRHAIKLLYERSNAPTMIVEFVNRLWGMFGLEPEYMPDVFHNNVVNLRRM